RRGGADANAECRMQNADVAARRASAFCILHSAFRLRRAERAVNWYDRLLQLQFTWRDAVDVVIVALIIYGILALIRGTRAMQVSIGLAFLASSFFVARQFDLPALEAISREILFYLPFAVIVLFQTEIRRALARMASNPVIAFFSPANTNVPADAIVGACGILAANRIGALIAVERT